MGEGDGRTGGLPARTTRRGLPPRRHRVSAVTRLLLVRHGQSTWNADGRWQGQGDPPLSPLGERQAAEAAERVQAMDALWSSDLRRAWQTAEIIGARASLAVHLEGRLRERDAG